ncbi:MAG: glycoside hydrolase family 25 [Clostridia bacterium]|nr:glycoside hydrolase family 25 [Clostridia bacterium]
MGKKRKKEINTWILLIVAIIAGTILFFGGRYAFFFVTEAGYDPDNPYPVKGIDVSLYQKDINWEGLKDDDIAFAFIKATEGSNYVDENFRENWEGARKAGVPAGAYHFMSFETDAEDQAENFINTVPKKHGSLPPVVDVEFYGDYADDPPDRSQVCDRLDIILEMLEKRYHRKPIIYTNNHCYNLYLHNGYDDYPIWISDPSIPDSLPDGREWTFCQYTFKGLSENVAGGEKYVDFNVFNGSKWDFRKFR